MRALVLHARRHAIGYLALFVALSGVAYAATKAPRNSVVSKSIKNANVKTADLANGAVTDDKLGDGAVTEGKLGVPLDFVPSQDVQRLFMNFEQCTSDPTGACDDFITGRLPGDVFIRGRCANEPVDADGGRLTISVSGAEEVRGYQIKAGAISPVDDTLDVQPANGAVQFGQGHFTTQASDGHVATVDFDWQIVTSLDGVAVCDVEGTAVSAG